MRVGVLALQGDFREHMHILRRIGAEAHEIRLPEQLADVDALIIPGGESTSIGKLAVEYGLVAPIRQAAEAGKPVWGTCAGMILLAKHIAGEMRGGQPLLGLMDITVQRNAFGRQTDSFEIDLPIEGLSGAPFHCVFIRAPHIQGVGPPTTVLARLPDGGPVVAARQGNLLATSFHPELTDDTRLHEYFLTLARTA